MAPSPAAVRRLWQLSAHASASPAAAAQPGVRYEAAEDAPFHPTRPELAIPADPLSQFDRIMVVIAHPDDESMAGGTIARFTGLGKAVRVVVLTNGDKGSGDLTMTSERLAELRAAEMHAAAAVSYSCPLPIATSAISHRVVNFMYRRCVSQVLGADAVLLGIPDGELENTYIARMRVAAQIRIFQPELLVTFNPTLDLTGYANGRAHRDHNIAGQIALDCFYPLARDHLQFKELWEPERYRQVLQDEVGAAAPV
jgi:LmbE family N-acetylglucosaminyl deacetylase